MPDAPLFDAAGSDIVVLASAQSSTSGVAWPAIIGGAVASLALSLLLVVLGSGLGLAAISPWANHGASFTGFAIGSVIWLIVMQWLSSGLGGYLTGRLRARWTGLHTHEVFFRDTANGFVTWAVATVAGVAIVASAAGFIVTGGAASVTAAASSHPGGAAQTAARIATPPAEPSVYVLDRLFRADGAATLTGEPDAKAQTRVIIVNDLKQGGVTAADKAYLTQLVAARAGVSKDTASSRVQAAMDDIQAAALATQKTADAARKDAAALSVFSALAMLIGAFIACTAAAIGGQQRDEY